MLSIQIDTKSLELVIYHQFDNIKLSFFASHMKSSLPLCTFKRCCTVIRYSKFKSLLFNFVQFLISYLAPLGDFGLLDNLDGHRKLIFGSFAGVDGAEPASAQQWAHFVGQFEGGPRQGPVHDRFQVRPEIRSEMAANAHPDISAKEVVLLWNDLKWRLYF